MDIARKKQQLREYYMTLRKRIPPADAERLSLRIANGIFALPRFIASELVLLYNKTGSEVDTAALLEMALDTGRAVALPYCRADGSLGAGRIRDPRKDLAPGRFGVMEPVNDLKGNVGIEEIGSVVCPGVAFDKNGGRLGRGGGHYDKLLRQIKGKAFIIGCAFDCQISDEPLPREEHDAAMDVVITETRAFPA